MFWNYFKKKKKKTLHKTGTTNQHHNSTFQSLKASEGRGTCHPPTKAVCVWGCHKFLVVLFQCCWFSANELGFKDRDLVTKWGSFMNLPAFIWFHHNSLFLVKCPVGPGLPTGLAKIVYSFILAHSCQGTHINPSSGAQALSNSPCQPPRRAVKDRPVQAAA